MRYLLALILLMPIACATADKTNKLSPGMTKAQVMDIMGEPHATKYREGAEVMVYSVVYRFYGNESEYWVVLRDNKVTGYGKPSDMLQPYDTHIILEHNVNNK